LRCCNTLYIAALVLACDAVAPSAAQAGPAELRLTSPAALPAATIGGSYVYRLAARGGTAPYTWSLRSAGGSASWAVTPEGWLEGAPTTTQTSSLTVEVTDSSNQTARGTVSITVNSNLAVMDQDLSTGRISLPPAVAGNAYVHQLQAAGGAHRYTWSIDCGSLPSGLKLSTNGIISGTPTSSGSFAAAVKVSDSAHGSATANATLSVSDPDQVARPSYNKSGGFFVYQGRLYDPHGKAFRIRGVNRVHFDNPDQPGMGNAQVNAVRFFMYDIGGRGAPAAAAYKDLAVEQNIAYGELPIITAANVAGTSKYSTGDPSTEDLASIVSWWVGNETAFAPIMNQLAINIANEWGPANSPDWASAYRRAVASLRSAGYTCPLVIDAGGSGQDIEDLRQFAAEVFNSDPEKNIIFSFHFYGLGKAYPPGSTRPELTSITSQLASLARSTGAAFIIGEFGPGRKIGPSPTDLAPGEIIAAAEAKGLGWLAWAWDDNDQGGCNSSEYSFSMTLHCGEYLAPARLTHYGLDVALNPQYGWIALASPASFFVEDRARRASRGVDSRLR
jgi:hypothetical protein